MHAGHEDSVPMPGVHAAYNTARKLLPIAHTDSTPTSH